MAEREIKTRFKLDGEQQFKTAMNDAAAAIKVLDSEQKLAQAQFKATGDAEAFATEQTRILNEKIAEQQKAVTAAETAMKQLKDKGVSPTDKSYQRWSVKLNTARTRLVNMESQLDQVTGSMVETRVEADATGESLQNVGKKLEWGNTITSLNTLNQALSSVLDTAGRIAAAVWNAEVDASKWADDLATAAAQTGIDVETYQSWEYASQFIDTNVDTIAKAMNRMAKNVGSESADLIKVFNKLGVSTRKADGSARNAQETFWDVIDALHNIKDPTEQAIYANQLFGDSWTQLKPLIDAGSEAYQNLAEKGLEVAVVSKQDVDALGAFNDAWSDMNSRLNKAQTTILARLAPAFTKIASSAGNAADAFNAFLDSEEGSAAIDALNSAIESLINSLLGEDNGAGTFAAIIDLATSAVNKLTEALTWITQNGDTVAGIVKGMGIAFAALKVAPSALAFVQLLSKIPIGKLTSLFGGGGGGASGAASGAASAAASGAGSAGASATAGSKILPAIAGLEAAALTEMAAESAYNMYKEVKEHGTFLGLGQRDENGSIDIGGIKIGGNQGETHSLWEALATTFGWNKTESHTGQTNIMGTWVNDEDLAGAGKAYQEMNKAQTEAAASSEELSKKTEEVNSRLVELQQSVSMLTMMGAPQEEIDALLAQIEEIYTNMASDMEAAGEQGAANLATGINAAASQPISAAEAMASRISSAVNSALGAVGRLGTINYGGLMGAAAFGNINATITMNGRKVGTMVAPVIDDYIGSEIQNGR